jgi:hypothetical protein
MPDLEAQAAKRFMKSLLDDKVTRKIGEAVRACGDDDSALKKDPAAYLAKAGFQLPRDITVTLKEEPLRLEQLPPDLRPRLPQLPRIRFRCFFFCRYYFIGGRIYRRCVIVCVLG